MPVQPLIVQTPRVSLIGGKELPKASGAGVPVPDLGNPFARLARDLQQKDEENRSITSKIEGQTYAEAERQAGVNAGLGPDGLYKQLKPVPRGDAYFQAAYLDTRARNAASDINNAMSTRFNELQSGDDPTEVKLARMKSYADGMVESLDPLLQENARARASSEMEQRGTAMWNEDENRRFQVAVIDNKRRVDDGFNKALSARSAGGNAQPGLMEANAAIDEQVRLKIKSPEGATAQKQELADKVEAVGMQAELTRHVMDGDIGPDEMDKFVIQYRNGGNVSIDIATTADPNTAAKPKGRAAEEGEDVTAYGEVKTFNTLEMKQKFHDPAIADEMAIRLNEVITFKRQELKANEKYVDYANAVKAAKGTENPINPATQEVQNEYAQKMVDTKFIESDEGQMLMVRMIEDTKYVAPAHLAWMLNGINGPDPMKSMKIAEIWNRLSTVKQGNIETGTVIRRNMKNQSDVVALDELVARANHYIKPGDAASVEAFANAQKEISRNPEMVNAAVAEFNADPANSDKGFNTRVMEAWTGAFGGMSVPPEFMSEMRVAYQINASSVTQPGHEAAFTKTFADVSRGWQASPVLYGGVQRTYDSFATNPPGYQRNRLAPWQNGAWNNPIVGANEGGIGIPSEGWAWANDYGVNVLNKLDDAGGIVFADEDQRSNFTNIMTTHPLDAFGPGAGRLTYKIIRGNRQHGQSLVVMTMNDGSEVTLMQRGADGRPAPILLDVGLVNAHLQSRASADVENKALWETVKRERVSVLDEQYRKVAADFTATPLPDWTEDELRRFLDENPDAATAYRKEVKSSAEAYAKAVAKRNAAVPQLPEGADIAPELLNMSKVGGPNVTVATVAAIGGALGDNRTVNNFMLNVASAESNFGQAEGSFRPRGDRGIFQINDGSQGAFREIVRRARIQGDVIQVAAEKLKPLGIDIANTVASDLDKPLVNGAFARLYFMADPRPITDDVWEQGELWKDHYNTHLGAGSVQGFVSKAGKVTMPDNVDPVTTGSLAPVSPGAGKIVSMDGRESPANFRALTANAQTMAQNLSARFGQPLRITPHGGTQPDARSPTSQHHHGTAIDIYVADMPDAEKKRLIVQAIANGYRGIGGYAAGDGKGTLHFDIRARDGKGPEGLATWWRHKPGKDSPGGSGPSWFVEAIAEGAEIVRSRGG